MIAMPIFVVLHSGFENSNATKMQIEQSICDLLHDKTNRNLLYSL